MAREIFAQQEYYSNSLLGSTVRISFKLAHTLYPGDDNASLRQQALDLIKSFIENPQLPSTSTLESCCDLPKSYVVHAIPSSSFISRKMESTSYPAATNSYGIRQPLVFHLRMVYATFLVRQHTSKEIELQQHNKQLQSQITELVCSMNQLRCRLHRGEYKVKDSNSTGQNMTDSISTGSPQLLQSPINGVIHSDGSNHGQISSRNQDPNVLHYINQRF